MTVNLNVQNLALRLLLLAAVLGFCTWLVFATINHFIVGTLADERIPFEKEKLAATLQTFPDSPRLNYRYAQLEMLSIDRDLDQATLHAQRAVNLSPNNYEYYLLLASAQELKKDRAAAEKTLEKALQLAPASTDAHWQMANVLLRQGKLTQSLPQFKIAATERRTLLPATLDLIWRASGGKIEAVEAATGDDTYSKLALADFFVKHSHPSEAVQIFNRIDRNERLTLPEGAALLNQFIDKDSLSLARELWVNLVSDNEANKTALLWNGGFELDALKNFMQFDWNVSRSDYAKLTIDTATVHSGSRSLKIEFLGKDTTRLDNEIKQVVALVPGQKYRLQCFVKTDKFSAPEGARIVVTETKTNTPVAASAPIALGTHDWQQIAVDFTAPPQSVNGLSITIKRLPKYSYDEPTRGSIWFDDFSIVKL
jgi:tetratricopeptide (TPR) repeat protein